MLNGFLFANELSNVTRFKITHLPRTIINSINTNFNYLKYCNVGRETDTYMKFAMIL